MCILCAQGKPQDHTRLPGRSQLGRRDFLKASTATAAAAGAMSLFSSPARADDDHGDPPQDSGRRGRRYVIRGGHVTTMDPKLGDFVKADVLVDGKKIERIAPSIHAPGAGEIDARGKIVMPGFIDTHHHQFETALRAFLANAVLINDQPNNPTPPPTYFEYVLLRFAPVYRPEDVYISELVGGLSQLDDGVTTVHDVSQIHHSPAHSDAAIQALFDTKRRAAFGYFESAGGVPGNQYPFDASRIKTQWFSSSDQLVHMIMGGEVYLGPQSTDDSWRIGRELDLQIAAHILSPFGIRPIFDSLAAGKGGNGTTAMGTDNLFIHVTGMSDASWAKMKALKEAAELKGIENPGPHVSLAFPIEMNMRHGMPPIIRMQQLGLEPSLSTDVEVVLTADFFTQMRSAMNLQRLVVNQMTLDKPNGNQNLPDPRNWELPQTAALSDDVPFFPYWPTPPAGVPATLTTRDVLRYATINGAKHLRLDKKTGSLTPGKEADILILDAEAINVIPLNNVPNAVVSMMERTNVETVIVAGKVRKWKGKLLDVDLRKLRREIENSRDGIFERAKVPVNLYG